MEFQHYLRGKEIVLTGMSLPKVKGLTTDQCEAMVRLSRLPAFKDLVSKVEADDVSIDRCCWSVCTKFQHTDTLTVPVNKLHSSSELHQCSLSHCFDSSAILHVDREQHSRLGCSLSVVRGEAVQ